VNRQEIPHNTPEQVRLYLQAALELVEELEPPDDLRGIFYAKAIDLLSAKQLIVEQLAPGVLGNLGRPH
jgi:hypothetical protein